MKKDYKNQSIIESSVQKWYNAETERLVSKGEDINNIFIVSDPYYNEGTIICDEYTMKFNGLYGIIDLAINGEKDSSIWKDVIDNVPAQFAAVLTGAPEHFLYRLSSNTSDKKEFYGFDPNEGESGSLLPIGIYRVVDVWRSASFDSLICSHDKTFFTECLNAF